MNIILRLHKNAVQLFIHNEENTIGVTKGFYSPSDKSTSIRMFTDKEINSKIRRIVTRHRDKLKFTDKLKYILLRNTAFVVIDRDVQPLLTINLINAYAALALDAREVFIVQPENFNIATSADNLKKLAITAQSGYHDTPISKLL